MYLDMSGDRSHHGVSATIAGMPSTSITRRQAAQLLAAVPGLAGKQARVFPGARWDQREPADLRMDAAALDRIANDLGGRGCIVRNGYLVKAWGDQAERGDLLSSAKPLLSTLLFFAVQEGKVPSVRARVAAFGWKLVAKDQTMELRHLANMTSGYARPEPPGAAWAYNDYAIMLYQKTLFDRIFRADPRDAAMHPARLGALGFEDGLEFHARTRRVSASARDFARLAWFWLQQGRWGEKQLLSRRFFARYQKPQVPAGLPQTKSAETNDYLGIGTFGGGSDHFTRYGPGIYGFNWWFNGFGRLHPKSLTWPDGPRDAFMSIGAGGNCSVMIPSLQLVLVSLRGKWGKLEPGDRQAPANQIIRLLVESFTAGLPVGAPSPARTCSRRPVSFPKPSGNKGGGYSSPAAVNINN